MFRAIAGLISGKNRDSDNSTRLVVISASRNYTAEGSEIIVYETSQEHFYGIAHSLISRLNNNERKGMKTSENDMNKLRISKHVQCCNVLSEKTFSKL